MLFVLFYYLGLYTHIHYMFDLNEYAQNYDSYEYGLPMYGEHIANMRNIVGGFLNRL